MNTVSTTPGNTGSNLLKINIGAGYKRYPGVLNIDDDINAKPDIVSDLEQGSLPLADNSVEYVIAHHILEHIGDGFIPLMKELYRVCASDAIIDIRVPHHFHEVFINDPTHKRPITVEGMRLFSKKFNQLEIDRQGASSTLGIKYNIDFEIVHYDYVIDPFYTDIIKNNTHEQNVRLHRECVNVAQETHIVLMVIK